MSVCHWLEAVKTHSWVAGGWGREAGKDTKLAFSGLGGSQVKDDVDSKLGFNSSYCN